MLLSGLSSQAVAVMRLWEGRIRMKGKGKRARMGFEAVAHEAKESMEKGAILLLLAGFLSYTCLLEYIL